MVHKLISTTNKEKNQIIVKNINASKIKINKRNKIDYNYVIQPSYWCINLIEAIKFVLDFNESELKDLL